MTRKEKIEREVLETLGLDLPPVEETPLIERFTDEQKAAERIAERSGVPQPSYRNLLAHMERSGPDCVLESAIHLPEEQYDKLAAKAKRMKYNKKERKWEIL